MVIYGTTQHAGQAHQPGTAARRALDGLLNSIYEPVTREWLTRQLPDEQKRRGLHLACGNGCDTRMLAALLGMDEDAVMVQAARQAGTLRNQEAVQFLQADPFSWETTQVFDFVYTRIWTGSWPFQSAVLQTIRRNLKTGGVLLVELLALSGYQAYPYNHAFARAMELIDLLEASRAEAAMQPEQVQVSLQQAGFELSERSAGLPAFIPRADNRVASLALEACREAILRRRGSTVEELNALLLELKEFEQQTDTLISRPGLLQLTARPAPPRTTIR